MMYSRSIWTTYANRKVIQINAKNTVGTTERYAQSDAIISLPPNKNLVVALKMVMQHDLRPSRHTIQHALVT
jgi:hypothetical protein